MSRNSSSLVIREIYKSGYCNYTDVNIGFGESLPGMWKGWSSAVVRIVAPKA